ncbi:MAG: HAD family phosphatase [Armatimonadetes bacterium]|nr:HAD family phosphatase [Armatimonadota bacterium]
MSRSPFELVSLDLDGTLLDAGLRVSPRNLAAVRRCRSLGARVVISSGRMHDSTLVYWRAMALDTPIISYNGAFIKHEETGEVLLDEHLDAMVARELVALCEERGLHLNYYCDDRLYIARPNHWGDLYAARTSSLPHPVGNLRALEGKPPTKLLIVADAARVASLLAELGPRYAGRAYVTTSFPEYLEFMPLSVDKGKALAVVARRFGIARERVVAFGDAMNDVPAIRWAGLGVAMENAIAEARAAADRIAPHHAEDGVAVVLEDLFGAQ